MFLSGSPLSPPGLLRGLVPSQAFLPFSFHLSPFFLLALLTQLSPFSELATVFQFGIVWKCDD